MYKAINRAKAAGCPYLVQWYAGFVGKDTGLVHVVRT
jgi:hypothetical protein